MGLAAIMAVSAMSISAFAANIPMRSEVDTKAASADNPVTYRTEDGIKIVLSCHNANSPAFIKQALIHHLTNQRNLYILR